MAVNNRSTYCTCGIKLHVNSVNQGVFECQPCHKRTVNRAYLETKLGNLIGEIAARVINERFGA